MILHHVILEQPFEAEAFLDEQENVIAAWSMNDANWRSEYMNPLLKALGVTEVYAVYGLDYDWEDDKPMDDGNDDQSFRLLTKTLEHFGE